MLTFLKEAILKTFSKVAFSLAFFPFLFPATAPAHHGNAAYDEKNPITIKGTVTEFSWTNPHVQIYLDVKDDKGKVVHWSVETYSPGKLVRAGWNRDVVKPGDQVSITLIAARSGAPVGFLHKLVLSDGTELKLQELDI